MTAEKACIAIINFTFKLSFLSVKIELDNLAPDDTFNDRLGLQC